MDNPNNEEQNQPAQDAWSIPPSSPSPAPSGAPVSEKARLAAAIGYIPPLFFIPLFFSDKDPFAVFHGKQGLVLTGAVILVQIIPFLIPILGAVIALLICIPLAVAIIVGAWKAYNGEMWEVPVVSQIAKKIEL